MTARRPWGPGSALLWRPPPRRPLKAHRYLQGRGRLRDSELDDRVTAELPKAGQQRAGAGNCASCHGGGPGHHGRAGGRARKQHRRAAELADHGPLQQGRPVGLRRAGGRGCPPDGVDLKLSNYSTTAAMNGSIALANNATLATVAANYGLKTVVDQRSLDIAARITPLEVDTKVANALLRPVTAARWPPSSRAETPPSRGRQRPDRLRPAVGRGHFLGGGLQDSSGPPKRGHHGGLDAALPALHAGRTSTGGRPK